MAITVKTLADGQLPDSKDTIFLADFPTMVNFLRLVNTDASAITVNLYVKRVSSSSRRIIDVDLNLAPGEMVDVFSSRVFLSLAPGDLIEADASVADKVD